jgi:TPR repeat protein
LANKWYQKASDMGNKLAMQKLAIQYMKGEGVQKDIRHAFRLLRQSNPHLLQRYILTQ